MAPIPIDSENIVISGISGRFPECDSVDEFKDNLLNGIDMVTQDDGRRWQAGYYGLPKRSGKLKDIKHFDAAFFGVHSKQAHVMDPQLRLLLEVTHEAIIDSGFNPSELRGATIGVYVGSCMAESLDYWTSTTESPLGYSVTGCNRSMFANRVSYTFDFNGPSIAVDTACSSSTVALQEACDAIKAGKCEAAIVAGVNLNLNPNNAKHFNSLKMFSADGKCKSFDASGDGYVRSETVTAVFIQKSNNARRIYCTILAAKANNDGYKKEGITYPSGEKQLVPIKGAYKECGVDPSTVFYVESHGPGTQVGDFEELNAIVNAFCTDGRKSPLRIGSVKSNMGHSEPASGICSLIKVIIAMESGVIPANLHFSKPNPNIPGLNNGKLKVVSENTPWDGGVIGVNSFGFGGVNVHVVLHSNPKQKRPSTTKTQLPRLITVSGRTRESVEYFLRRIKAQPRDEELYALLDKIHERNISGHCYRGFGFAEEGDFVVEGVPNEKRPIWFLFSGMGSQWNGMGKTLMDFEPFRKSILRSSKILTPKGFDLLDVINGEADSSRDLVKTFVAVTSIQIALVDVLKILNIKPEGIIGHSVGEISCGYADGALTHEEAILISLARAKALAESALPKGAMASVGITSGEFKKRNPGDISVACYNSKDNLTLSGPPDSINAFVDELNKDGFFTRKVDVFGLAFHSKYISASEGRFRNSLEEFLRNPKRRSSKWVSSSVLENQWGSALAQHASIDYYVNNLLSPVYFQQACARVPEKAVVIEIAPHAVLQAILRRSLSKDVVNIGLISKAQPDLKYVLSNIGRIYNAGGQPKISAMYPPVEFPVSRGTPMISDMVKWDHSSEWAVANFCSKAAKFGEMMITIDLSKKEYSYLRGHIIDGENLIPESALIVFLWQVFSRLRNKNMEDTPVAIKNIKFHKKIILSEENPAQLIVCIFEGSGKFEITHEGVIITTGQIYMTENENFYKIENDEKVECTTEGEILLLDKSDIYKELNLRGHNYEGGFKGIVCSDPGSSTGVVAWEKNWVLFINNIIQYSILEKDTRDISEPLEIERILIDPNKMEFDVSKSALINGRNEKSGLLNGGNNENLLNGVNKTNLLSGTNEENHLNGANKNNLPSGANGENDLNGANKNNLPSGANGEDPFNRLNKENPVSEENKANLFNGGNEENILNERNKNNLSSGANGENLFNRVSEVNVLNGTNEECHLNEENKNNLQSGVNGENIFNGGNKNNLLSRANEKNRLNKSNEENLEEINVYLNKSRDFIRAGGVEIKGITFKITPKCAKLQPDPILEKYEFAPFENADLIEKTQLLSAIGQLLIENNANVVNFKIVALLADYNEESFLTIIGGIRDMIENEPRLRFEGVIVAKDSKVGVKIDSTRIVPNYSEGNAHLIVLKSMLTNRDDGILTQALSSVKTDGFILFEEGKGCNDFEMLKKHSLKIVSRLETPEHLYVLAKRSAFEEETPAFVIIEVIDENYDWFDALKQAMIASENTHSKIYLVSQGNESTGLIGMVKCLIQEPGGSNIRSFYIEGAREEFSLESKFYKKQVEKDLVINVYRKSKWGAFRHFRLENSECEARIAQAFLDARNLRWVQKPDETEEKDDSFILCNVCYIGLNREDFVLVKEGYNEGLVGSNEGVKSLGMEFSGVDLQGNRVMGIVKGGAVATSVHAESDLLWSVPEEWALEEAATVPMAYSLSYLALITKARLHQNDAILIHNGLTTTGQAAIRIALQLNCDVFITVANNTEKGVIKKIIAALKEENIIDFNDNELEEIIRRKTNGKGVDVVFNCLDGRQIGGVIKCLARNGTVLHVGSDFNWCELFGTSKGFSAHFMNTDSLFSLDSLKKQEMNIWIAEGLKNGFIQPLQKIRFNGDELNEAFSFLEKEDPFRKVVLEIKSPNNAAFHKQVEIIKMTYFNPDDVYVVIGGLGGFGLELIRWLVSRRAKKIVISSRNGIKTGYQSLLVNKWKRNNVKILFSKHDVTTENGVTDLLIESKSLGKIGGVFNLALVLIDGFIANRTKTDFEAVCKPKAHVAKHLDKLTRVLAEDLDYFVMFSSNSCGRGNPGQSNYGYANSVMERVCEERKKSGLPALTIQWGPIADTGAIINTNCDIKQHRGTLLQKISSCLETMDIFLAQRNAVVSSFVLAEKKGVDQVKGLADSVGNILGLSNYFSVSKDVTLGELGMDSLMSAEIKNAIRELNGTSLSSCEIRELTFERLLAIEKQ